MPEPADSSAQRADRDRHPEPVGERRRETGTGAATRTMWQGGLGRALLWGAIGAVIGLAVGFIPWGDIPLWLRLVAFGVAGLLAGSVAGFVYGAGRARDLDQEARHETAFETIEEDRPRGRS